LYEEVKKNRKYKEGERTIKEKENTIGYGSVDCGVGGKTAGEDTAEDKKENRPEGESFLETGPDVF
jgi:hypothetical protein